MLKDIKKGLIIGVTAGISMVLVGISYAAFIDITNVDSNTKLSSTMMNNLIGNIKYNNSQLLGVNQTRQDVTNIREKGKDYLNDTGKTIILAYTYDGAGTGNDNHILVDGLIVDSSKIYNTHTITLSAIIPNGSTYRIVKNSTNTDTNVLWVELRPNL